MILKYLKTNKELRKELEETKEMLREERDEAINIAADYQELLDMSTEEIVIKKIIGEGIKWYDYKSKSKEERRTYYAEAQNFLNNIFVQNERKKGVADLISKISIESDSFEQVVDYRMTINGLNLLIERALRIENPDAKPKPTQNDVHSTL